MEFGWINLFGACIMLMLLLLLVWKFGFGSVEEFLIYLIGNGVLLLCYYLFYRKHLVDKAERKH